MAILKTSSSKHIQSFFSTHYRSYHIGVRPQSLHFQYQEMAHHAHAIGSSRVQGVVVLDDDDLDIVMEDNENGKLRDLN
jgi:hypothetical protein